MKVVIDSAIPYISGVLEPYAEVVYRAGDEFSAEDVKDADALIIRTRTRCGEALLGGSSVKLIATATIGFDRPAILRYARYRGRDGCRMQCRWCIAVGGGYVGPIVESAGLDSAAETPGYCGRRKCRLSC